VSTCMVFDVDGVLLDSYRGIRFFYLNVLPKINGFNNMDGEVLYRYELYAEGLGVLRSEWWRRVIPGLRENDLRLMLEEYWKIRRKYTVPMPGLHYTLRELVRRGICVGSVSWKDDIPGLKVERMREHGLTSYFRDNIVIVGDNVSSRLEGIHLLAQRYRPARILYVDDKPGSLWRIKKGDSRIETVHF
jgi:putative hydrolase of the HAD superfamily